MFTYIVYVSYKGGRLSSTIPTVKVKGGGKVRIMGRGFASGAKETQQVLNVPGGEMASIDLKEFTGNMRFICKGANIRVWRDGKFINKKSMYEQIPSLSIDGKSSKQFFDSFFKHATVGKMFKYFQVGRFPNFEYLSRIFPVMGDLVGKGMKLFYPGPKSSLGKTIQKILGPMITQARRDFLLRIYLLDKIGGANLGRSPTGDGTGLPALVGVGIQD